MTENLEKIASDYKAMHDTVTRRMVICAGTGCIANGSLKLYDALLKEIEKAGINVAVELKTEDHAKKSHLSKSGCQGFCQMGPLLSIEPDGILYCRAHAADAAEIVEKTLKNNELIDRLVYKSPTDGSHCRGTNDIPFYTRQRRTVLKACGHVNPEDIREYIYHDGYKAAQKAYTEMTDEEFDSVIAIDLAGPFKCIRAVAKIMQKQGSGSIINTSSMVGLYGSPCQASYASAKAGVIGLTKSCAKELGRYGIRVNAVAPGVVMTDMVAASVDERMMAGLQQLTPLGRAAQPEELAPAYVYLASDDASFTTGAILSVDGGIVM